MQWEQKFHFLLVLCTSEMNRRSCGKRSNPHAGHAQGPLKSIPLCVKFVGHKTKIKT